MTNKYFEQVLKMTKNKFFILSEIKMIRSNTVLIFGQKQDVDIYGLYWIDFDFKGYTFNTVDFNGGNGVSRCDTYHNLTEEQMEVVEEINEKLKQFFEEVS